MNMRSIKLLVAGAVAAVLHLPQPTRAKVVSAVRATDRVEIDGRLDDRAWADAPRRTDFWQRAPVEGAEPSFATEFRVLYDDAALYVGIRAFDPDPSQIRGQLTRRDAESSSDWLLVGIDSYEDRRTAFVFAINPVDVQRDLLIFDDTSEDPTWDAVWDGATSVDEQGWSAEFRLPFSQLRFARATEYHWGLQVTRVVQRTQELSYWAPQPTAKAQGVSLYGEIQGIRDITPPRRLEILPYTVGGVALASVDRTDPLNDGVDARGNVGVDFRYGLSSNLTLSVTVNPDFGQVEADPSDVNLTAYETFLEERRPFFVEGADIFRFGLGQGGGDASVEQLFYPRRIGAAPHHTGRDVAPFAVEDQWTTIYGAAKLSGKTAGGWSIGALSALTGEETSRIESELGERDDVVIEPLTNYSVLRLKKDFNAGRTLVGLAATGVQRRLEETGLDWLHDRAFTGGIELAHRTPNGAWQLETKLLGSHVHGAAEAIDRTQRASQRYYQRPDADYLDYDPTRTSLNGLGFQGLVTRHSARWRGSVGWNVLSPGFEANDLGFQRSADQVVNWAWVQHRDEKPGDYLRSYHIDGNLWSGTTWEPRPVAFGGNASGSATFLNYWSAQLGAGSVFGIWDPNVLRGGPTVRGNTSHNMWGSLSTDHRKSVSASLSGNGGIDPTSASWNTGASASLMLRAHSNFEVGVGPFWQRQRNDTQYVGEFVDAMGDPVHVLGRLNQTTVGMTVRLNYTLSPGLSLQLYAQPFVSAGAFGRYKEAAAVRSTRYAERFHAYTDQELMEAGGELWFDVVRHLEPRPGQRGRERALPPRRRSARPLADRGRAHGPAQAQLLVGVLAPGRRGCRGARAAMAERARGARLGAVRRHLRPRLWPRLEPRLRSRSGLGRRLPTDRSARRCLRRWVRFASCLRS
jgi:hypothetical protein